MKNTLPELSTRELFHVWFSYATKAFHQAYFLFSIITTLKKYCLRYLFTFTLAADKCMHQSVSMAFRGDDNERGMGKGMAIGGSRSAHRTTQIQ